MRAGVMGSMLPPRVLPETIQFGGTLPLHGAQFAAAINVTSATSMRHLFICTIGAVFGPIAFMILIGVLGAVIDELHTGAFKAERAQLAQRMSKLAPELSETCKTLRDIAFDMVRPWHWAHHQQQAKAHVQVPIRAGVEQPVSRHGAKRRHGDMTFDSCKEADHTDRQCKVAKFSPAVVSTPLPVQSSTDDAKHDCTEQQPAAVFVWVRRPDGSNSPIGSFASSQTSGELLRLICQESGYDFDLTELQADGITLHKNAMLRDIRPSMGQRMPDFVIVPPDNTSRMDDGENNCECT